MGLFKMRVLFQVILLVSLVLLVRGEESENETTTIKSETEAEVNNKTETAAEALEADGTRPQRSIRKLTRLLLGGTYVMVQLGHVPPHHPLVNYPDPIQKMSTRAKEAVIAALPEMWGKEAPLAHIAGLPNPLVSGRGFSEGSGYISHPEHADESFPYAGPSSSSSSHHQGYNPPQAVEQDHPLLETTVSNSKNINSYYSVQAGSDHPTNYPQPKQQQQRDQQQYHYEEQRPEAYPPRDDPPGYYEYDAAQLHDAPVPHYTAPGDSQYAPYHGAGGDPGEGESLPAHSYYGESRSPSQEQESSGSGIYVGYHPTADPAGASGSSEKKWPRRQYESSPPATKHFQSPYEDYQPPGKYYEEEGAAAPSASSPSTHSLPSPSTSSSYPYPYEDEAAYPPSEYSFPPSGSGGSRPYYDSHGSSDPDVNLHHGNSEQSPVYSDSSSGSYYTEAVSSLPSRKVTYPQSSSSIAPSFPTFSPNLLVALPATPTFRPTPEVVVTRRPISVITSSSGVASIPLLALPPSRPSSSPPKRRKRPQKFHGFTPPTFLHPFLKKPISHQRANPPPESCHPFESKQQCDYAAPPPPRKYPPPSSSSNDEPSGASSSSNGAVQYVEHPLSAHQIHSDNNSNQPSFPPPTSSSYPQSSKPPSTVASYPPPSPSSYPTSSRAPNVYYERTSSASSYYSTPISPTYYSTPAAASTKSPKYRRPSNPSHQSSQYPTPTSYPRRTHKQQHRNNSTKSYNYSTKSSHPYRRPHTTKSPPSSSNNKYSPNYKTRTSPSNSTSSYRTRGSYYSSREKASKPATKPVSMAGYRPYTFTKDKRMGSYYPRNSNNNNNQASFSKKTLQVQEPSPIVARNYYPPPPPPKSNNYSAVSSKHDSLNTEPQSHSAPTIQNSTTDSYMSAYYASHYSYIPNHRFMARTPSRYPDDRQPVYNPNTVRHQVYYHPRPQQRHPPASNITQPQRYSRRRYRKADFYSDQLNSTIAPAEESLKESSEIAEVNHPVNQAAIQLTEQQSQEQAISSNNNPDNTPISSLVNTTISLKPEVEEETTSQNDIDSGSHLGEQVLEVL